MAYATPKVNWTSTDGVTETDLNRIENNTLQNHTDIVANKVTTDAHAALTDAHKTAAVVRTETGELRVNVRTNDPVGLVAGQIWLRSDL